MENKEHNNEHGHNCARMGACCHAGGKHFLIRWILGVAILFIVFSIGMKIGEFKASIEGSYYGFDGFGRHRTMMWGGYGDPNDYYYPGPGMMRGYYQNKVELTTTPR
jgi:hypothetical protein